MKDAKLQTNHLENVDIVDKMLVL